MILEQCIIIQDSKENFAKIEKSKFSKKNFDEISFGNHNYSKFSKVINFNHQHISDNFKYISIYCCI